MHPGLIAYVRNWYNDSMEHPEIIIAVVGGLLLLALTIYILAKVCKAVFAFLAFILKPVFWVFRLFSGGRKKQSAKEKPVRYKSLAEFADVIASDPTAIDSNLHAIFTDLRDEIGSIYDATTNDFDKAVLAGPLASLDKIANAKIKDKSKPMFPTLFNLADAIAEKDVKLDSALRGIFLEIYDHVELYTPNDATEGAYEPLAYDVERTLFPNDGPSQSQAEAASKRQAKKEAAIKDKMTTPRESTPV